MKRFLSKGESSSLPRLVWSFCQRRTPKSNLAAAADGMSSSGGQLQCLKLWLDGINRNRWREATAAAALGKAARKCLFVRLSVCLSVRPSVCPLSVCLFVCALCSPAITTIEAPERVLANLRVEHCTWSTGLSGRKSSEEFLFTSYLVGFSRQHPCSIAAIEIVAWGKQKSFQKFTYETETNLVEELISS